MTDRSQEDSEKETVLVCIIFAICSIVILKKKITTQCPVPFQLCAFRKVEIKPRALLPLAERCGEGHVGMKNGLTSIH